MRITREGNMEEIETRYIGRKEELDLIRGVLKNMLSEAASKKKKEDFVI